MKEPSEKKAIIKKMMKEGKTYKQISEETGIHYGTVGIYGGKLKKAEREKKCFNGDRHLCRLANIALPVQEVVATISYIPETSVVVIRKCATNMRKESENET